MYVPACFCVLSGSSDTAMKEKDSPGWPALPGRACGAKASSAKTPQLSPT